MIKGRIFLLGMLVVLAWALTACAGADEGEVVVEVCQLPSTQDDVVLEFTVRESIGDVLRVLLHE